MSATSCSMDDSIDSISEEEVLTDVLSNDMSGIYDRVSSSNAKSETTVGDKYVESCKCDFNTPRTIVCYKNRLWRNPFNLWMSD